MCTGNCNQGRNCSCAPKEREVLTVKVDMADIEPVKSTLQAAANKIRFQNTLIKCQFGLLLVQLACIAALGFRIQQLMGQ